jgi:hypothetical protein
MPPLSSDREDDLLAMATLEDAGLFEDRQTGTTNPLYLPVKLTDSPLSLSPEDFYAATKKSVAKLFRTKVKELIGDMAAYPELRGVFAALIAKSLGASVAGESLRVCSGCKNIVVVEEDGSEKHLSLDTILDKFGVKSSHGICTDCFSKLYPDLDLPQISSEKKD